MKQKEKKNEEKGSHKFISNHLYGRRNIRQIKDKISLGRTIIRRRRRSLGLCKQPGSGKSIFLPRSQAARQGPPVCVPPATQRRCVVGDGLRDLIWVRN